MNPRIVSLCCELGIPVQLIAARGLSECEEAATLVVAEVGADARNHLLIPAATDPWQELKAAALHDGIALSIVSAFRRIDRQVEIVHQKFDNGVALEEILAICAPPGFSEHHTGRAIDLSTPGSPVLEVEFDQPPAFAWLTVYAQKFGYPLSYPAGNQWGYQHEPWHWCFHDPQ